MSSPPSGTTGAPSDREPGESPHTAGAGDRPDLQVPDLQVPDLQIEVRSAVFQVRRMVDGQPPGLAVFLARTPAPGAWALPGGGIAPDETLIETAERLLATTLDGAGVSHLEQLEVFSDPGRIPGVRTIASTYLGLVPTDSAGPLPDDATWCDVDQLPDLAADHDRVIDTARRRLAGKLSYTNIAFALAPDRFPMSELAEIYCAALGYEVDATNLLRILSRRAVIGSTGTVGRTGRSGGRPPSLYAFTDTQLRVTDEFATLRPPM